MQRYSLTLLATWLVVVSAVQGKVGEYPQTNDRPSNHATEDKLLTNIIRARNATKQSLRVEDEEDDRTRTEKKPRTAVVEVKEAKGLSCCGSRYSSVPSVRPDIGYNRLPSETGRYPSYYGDRNGDRYNWQTYNRPPSSTGSSGRPSSGNYGNNYPGSGVYGGSQPGDRYLPSPNRPSGGTYGGGYGGGYGGYGSYGGGRPGGYGDGISGTFSDGSEFDGPEEPPSYPDGGPPQHSNIQTQKAVALKALAGVALIGAAAALASNPVLLPLSLVSGRRKRSEYPPAGAELEMERIVNAMTNNISKAYGNLKRGQKVIISPRCVARMTCDIQKAYISDLRRNSPISGYDENAEHRFTNLIRSNVLNSDNVNASVKKVVKLAITIGSNEGNCSVFPCNFIRKG